VKLLHKHDKLTQCCRAFTLALARLFCLRQSFSVMCLLQASPFMIEVYAEKCTPSLKVSNIDIGGKILMNAVVQMVIRKVVLV